MTPLSFFNRFVFQWAGFRLARVCDEEARQIAWSVIGPVLPLSGWGRPYIGRDRALVTWRCAS